MGVEIDAVLDIEVADEEIVTRCPDAVSAKAAAPAYHLLYKQPKVEEGVTSAAAPLFSARTTTRIQ